VFFSLLFLLCVINCLYEHAVDWLLVIGLATGLQEAACQFCVLKKLVISQAEKDFQSLPAVLSPFAFTFDRAGQAACPALSLKRSLPGCIEGFSYYVL
jgi:hypothetical protein